MKEIFREYIAYLRDNKEGYWFKRKLYGWGWTPARWQGWASILLYVVALIWFARRLDPDATLTEALPTFFLPLAVLTLLLIVVAYLTGEKPKWMWGLREEKGTEGPPPNTP